MSSTRISKKMTATEWSSIVEIAVKDQIRNDLLAKMQVIAKRFEDGNTSFSDVDEFHRTKEAILEREWQILSNKTGDDFRKKIT